MLNCSTGEEDNDNSRKCYTRNELLFLKNSPLSQIRPANIANIPGVTVPEEDAADSDALFMRSFPKAKL